MFDFTEKEHNKHYKKLLNELEQVQTLHKGFNFGAATVLATVFDWCKKLEDQEFETVTPNDVRKAFINFINANDEIRELFHKLTLDYDLETDKDQFKQFV